MFPELVFEATNRFGVKVEIHEKDSCNMGSAIAEDLTGYYNGFGTFMSKEQPAI